MFIDMSENGRPISIDVGIMRGLGKTEYEPDYNTEDLEAEITIDDELADALVSGGFRADTTFDAYVVPDMDLDSKIYLPDGNYITLEEAFTYSMLKITDDARLLLYDRDTGLAGAELMRVNLDGEEVLMTVARERQEVVGIDQIDLNDLSLAEMPDYRPFETRRAQEASMLYHG